MEGEAAEGPPPLLPPHICWQDGGRLRARPGLLWAWDWGPAVWGQHGLEKEPVEHLLPQNQGINLEAGGSGKEWAGAGGSGKDRPVPEQTKKGVFLSKPGNSKQLRILSPMRYPWPGRPEAHGEQRSPRGLPLSAGPTGAGPAAIS